MSEFYKNLKIIMDERKLTSYEIQKKTNIPSQTIDNMIKKKVKKPKPENLKKLADGLNISIPCLMYGTDSFNGVAFTEILEKKGVSLDELVIETGVSPMTLLQNKFPSLFHQEQIAKFLEMDKEDIFIPSIRHFDILAAKGISSYVRPDIDDEPDKDKDLFKMYQELSPISKRLVYNMIHDLVMVETKYVVTYTERDYWEK